MREIKFRGKKLGTGNWAYGFLAGIEGLRIGRTGRIVSYDGENIYDSLVYADTIGQYTGLDDANGEEIYEGDIVRYRLTDERYKKNPRYSNLPIHYDGRQARFEAGNIYWDTLRSDKVEVIGNIYDNPELIEK